MFHPSGLSIFTKKQKRMAGPDDPIARLRSSEAYMACVAEVIKALIQAYDAKVLYYSIQHSEDDFYPPSS